VFRADRVGHQVLCLLDDAARLTPVVEPVEDEHVRGEHPCSDDVEDPWVGPLALAMSWRPEADVTASAERLERLEDRDPAVVECGHACRVSILVPNMPF
jgi:hypothetical protein